MMGAMSIAATGMGAQQSRIDLVANNLANLSTAGFKASQMSFHDLMSQEVRPGGTLLASGGQVPTSVEMGLGTQVAATERVFTQGSFQQTGNPTDMTIQGEGFFQVTLPDGTVGYTRDGSFSKDSQGNLVTAEGYILSPPVTIPANATNISVSSDGKVSVTVPGQSAPQQVGQLTLATFPNDQGLQAAGNNVYLQTAASGTPVTGNPAAQGFGSVMQGYLEGSNVSEVNEMINMISAQHAYEVNAKVISSADQMLSIVAEMKR